MSIPVMQAIISSGCPERKCSGRPALLRGLLLLVVLAGLVGSVGPAWSQTLHRGLGPAPDSLDIHAARAMLNDAAHGEAAARVEPILRQALA